MGLSARQKASRNPTTEGTTMLEAFNELMADPTSRAELVGGVIEVLIFAIPAGAYILSLRIRSLLRRLRYGTDRPRVIVGRATSC